MSYIGKGLLRPIVFIIMFFLEREEDLIWVNFQIFEAIRLHIQLKR